MPTLTPPDVPEGVDLMEHIWATRNVIRSWHPKNVVFTDITLHTDARFELLTHPRMANAFPRKLKLNSLWGIPLTFSDWNRGPRSYTVTYQEA